MQPLEKDSKAVSVPNPDFEQDVYGEDVYGVENSGISVQQENIKNIKNNNSVLGTFQVPQVVGTIYKKNSQGNFVYTKGNWIPWFYFVLGCVFILPFPFFCFGIVFIIISMISFKKYKIVYNEKTKTVTVEHLGAILHSIGRKHILTCKYNDVKYFVVRVHQPSGLLEFNNLPIKIMMVLNDGKEYECVAMMEYPSASMITTKLKAFHDSKVGK